MLLVRLIQIRPMNCKTATRSLTRLATHLSSMTSEVIKHHRFGNLPRAVMKILQIILNVLHVHYIREGPAMEAYRASVVKREASPLRYALNRPSTMIIPCLVQMGRSHKLEGTWV